MASNSFGTFLRITTWGESHGKAIGVVIDGCPAGLSLNDEDINLVLKKELLEKTLMFLLAKNQIVLKSTQVFLKVKPQVLLFR